MAGLGLSARRTRLHPHALCFGQSNCVARCLTARPCFIHSPALVRSRERSQTVTCGCSADRYLSKLQRLTRRPLTNPRRGGNGHGQAKHTLRLLDVGIVPRAVLMSA